MGRRIDGEGREKSKVFFRAIYPRAYYVRLEADGMEYLMRVYYAEPCLIFSSSCSRGGVIFSARRDECELNIGAKVMSN
jgi:hypothetical protein